MLLNFFVERFGANGFVGEHLWLGHLGHFFVFLTFGAALFSFASYLGAEFNRQQPEAESKWRRAARISFYVHSLAVLGIFVLLFLMILNHWFEYHYAWRHSSTDLPLKYIISSFWEGQEGSFLLWMFWLAVLGLVGIWVIGEYENPVLAIIALTQVFLASMVFGVYVFGFKLGSSPFILLRDQMLDAPIFQQKNYLEFIKDGNGLNVLLQNYWMTIHPPVLFLGFASVSFPFAFALASLLRRDPDGWIKPATPWVLFSIAALGTGILMGGAWAYESLSFGGFWAWDPVENMSFVPWLMVVAGLHTMLVYRYTKQSLISTYIFLLLGFILVLYSTYLTRSGRLGDTSVHSFTDDGLEPQLLAYLSFFFVTGFTLLLLRVFKKELPQPAKEEDLWSREFWMFIGTLVLLLSAVQMIITTSIPIWNLLFYEKIKLLSDKIAPPEDAIAHYNSIQIWLGILAAALTGLVQYLAYKTGKIPATAKWATYSFVAALGLAVLIAWGMDINFTQQYKIDLTALSQSLFFKFPFVSAYFLFLLASLYAVTGNLGYMWMVLKGNIKLSGGSIAHFGFGLFLVGVVLSQGKQEVISTNGVPMKGFDAKERAENVLLLRGSTDKMGDYYVTYVGKDSTAKSTFYKVRYEKKDARGKITETFVLAPEATLLKEGNLNANPDTKHYLHKDVFTHISSVPDNTNLKDTAFTVTLKQGDTTYTNNAYVIFNGYNKSPQLPTAYQNNNYIGVGINLTVKTLEGASYTAAPLFLVDVKNSTISSQPVQVNELGLGFDVLKIDPATEAVSLGIRYREKPADFIIMKAVVFPYINLVWLGGIITFAGSLLSMVRRHREKK